jgi:predicted O-linked N-acetylglucosamine transferase (SPINDLY family)
MMMFMAAALLYETWVAHCQSAAHKPVALFNWGTVLGSLRRHEAAEAAYRQALALKPDFAQARLNLAHQFEHLGRSEDALATWREVYEGAAQMDCIGADPLDLQLHALNNSARVLEVMKRLPEAEALMRRSLELQPQQPDVIQHYVHVRQKQCAWPGTQAGRCGHAQPVADGHLGLLAMMSVSDDPALQLLAAQRFAWDKVPKAPPVALHTTMPARRAASASATCRATCTCTPWAC